MKSINMTRFGGQGQKYLNKGKHTPQTNHTSSVCGTKLPTNSFDTGITRRFIGSPKGCKASSRKRDLACKAIQLQTRPLTLTIITTVNISMAHAQPNKAIARKTDLVYKVIKP